MCVAPWLFSLDVSLAGFWALVKMALRLFWPRRFFILRGGVVFAEVRRTARASFSRRGQGVPRPSSADPRPRHGARHGSTAAKNAGVAEAARAPGPRVAMSTSTSFASMPVAIGAHEGARVRDRRCRCPRSRLLEARRGWPRWSRSARFARDRRVGEATASRRSAHPGRGTARPPRAGRGPPPAGCGCAGSTSLQRGSASLPRPPARCGSPGAPLAPPSPKPVAPAAGRSLESHSCKQR